MIEADQRRATPLAADEALPRAFGFWSGATLVAASMIGTGILLTPGYTIQAVQNHAVAFGLWLLGALIAFCGALTLAEMATAIPKAGGEYSYVSSAFGPLPAFLYGWTSLVLGFAAPTAVVALTMSKYLFSALPEAYRNSFAAAGGFYGPAVASATIAALTLIHCLGQRESGVTQTLTTLFKYGTLMLLATLGLLAGREAWSRLWDIAAAWRHAPAWFVGANSDAFHQPDWAARGRALRELYGSLPVLGASMIFVNYAYTGWNGAAYLAGELRSPNRLMPRCLLAGCGSVALLYMLVNFTFAVAFSESEICAMKDVEVLPLRVAERLSNTAGAGEALALVVGLGLLATVSAFLLAGSRVAFAMARGGHFLSLAAGWNDRRNVPVPALLILGSLSAGLAWVAPLRELLSVLGTGLTAAGVVFAATIFELRRRPDYRPGFRVPLFPLPTLIYLAASIGMTAAMCIMQPAQTAGSFLFILLGVPVFAISRWLSRGKVR